MTNPVRGDVVAPDQASRIVLETYSRVPPSGSSVAEAMYPSEALAVLPEPVKELALGVGHPCGFADLREGEDDLALGSGGGIDTFLAARAVGPAGKAIGLDVTREMVAKGEEHARLTGVTNVEFRQGAMEEIPLADESVDVIISNASVRGRYRTPEAFAVHLLRHFR